VKIIIIGAHGMLRHTLNRNFQPDYDVLGLARKKTWSPEIKSGYDIVEPQKIKLAIQEYQPDVVLNCAGIIKQIEESKKAENSILINALWPHKLASYCENVNARLIHFSTDCVFSGETGSYTEEDIPDARDLYGLSKLLGELSYKHCLTIRTSIIGHELNSSRSLINWFLQQTDKCQGYTNAIYSGFPTISLARILKTKVFPRIFESSCSGLYHLSSQPISKYDLLTLVSKIYGKDIKIIPCSKPKIDRSLISKRFRMFFNYTPEEWAELVSEMYQFYKTI